MLKTIWKHYFQLGWTAEEEARRSLKVNMRNHQASKPPSRTSHVSIIKIFEKKELPDDDGFFFGESQGSCVESRWWVWASVRQPVTSRWSLWLKNCTHRVEPCLGALLVYWCSLPMSSSAGGSPTISSPSIALMATRHPGHLPSTDFQTTGRSTGAQSVSWEMRMYNARGKKPTKTKPLRWMSSPL